MAKPLPLRIQFKVWGDEDPELHALLQPLDSGSRARAILRLLRTGMLAIHGLHVSDNRAPGDRISSAPQTSVTPKDVAAPTPIAPIRLPAGFVIMPNAAKRINQ